MINFDSTSQYSKSDFSTAKPFPHISIDNFFLVDVIKKLLLDFPEFDHSLAKNEYGEPGPKCVISDIKSISPYYDEFFKYIASNNFLEEISRLTGVENLLFDEQMYGGGTHENLSGAELDPHVDFNYDPKTGNHRRLNVLIYLNKEWDLNWGGAIELHSNPSNWNSSQNPDEIFTYNCEFNRCVIFQTDETSWHGFKRIQTPDNQVEVSRKLISIYLYTKNRPQEEIAPSHGTFYMPYPPLEALKSIRNKGDYEEAIRLIAKRDSLLLESYKREKYLSGKLEKYERNIQPKVLGYALVVENSVKGFHHDNWIENRFSLSIVSDSVIRHISISCYTIKSEARSAEVIVCYGDVRIIENVEISSEEHSFCLDIDVAIPESNEFSIEVNSEPIANKYHHDPRNLSMVISSIRLEHYPKNK